VHISAFQALSDPTRRRVLETLRHGEQPVNGIVGELAIRQSGVSRHLRILLNAGFVTVRAEGQRRLYSLCPEPFRQIETWLSGYRQIWDARLERFSAALDERQVKRAAQKPHQKRKVR
jgi:DNA-binding transcriptional ArsR family regulator